MIKHDNKTRQVFAFSAKAVGQPGAHAGPDQPGFAGKRVEQRDVGGAVGARAADRAQDRRLDGEVTDVEKSDDKND